MILLRTEHYNKILLHAEADYPYECCGLVVGRFFEDQKIILAAHPISNAREEESKRNRFLITPEEYARGEQRARQNGLDVVGFYHSHPDHPAIPSQFDLDHAWPLYSYLIVSVIKGEAVELLSWELAEDRTEFNIEKIEEGR
jgi:proteasome lid subunit RPN8/RPN11